MLPGRIACYSEANPCLVTRLLRLASIVMMAGANKGCSRSLYRRVLPHLGPM